ncbi:Cell division protein FtsZ [Nymphon striatum]|nr:Cell division protein FtsZ [Nymphon striatum]
MSNNTEFEGISFDLPKNQSNVIKVIGVGGGGSNAINHMFQAGINGVDFVILNTDSQALTNSSVPNKIQLGVSLTEGLGAGANPEVGEQAAIESTEDIKTMLDVTTKMVFITAGMGGGTGTGAAPVIAKMAKEMDILTVGIVTMPFQFEGKMRCEQAQLGIERLRNNVDSLIVINNNKLREVYGNLGFKAGFSKADEVLATAARGIAEVITHHYTQNIDLRDAKTVLSNSGTAIMGSSISTGAGRANEAIMKALDSPLLLIDEIGEINDHIQVEAGHGANIIMGVGEDPELGESIAVTVIATGFDIDQQDDIVNIEDEVAVKETVVKHTLIDEMEELDLIPTTNYIKNFNVFYEEVIAENVSEDDFIIIDSDDTLNDIDVVDHQVVAGIEIEEDQIEMSFDLPLVTDNEEENENTIVFSLDEEIGEMDVNDHIEVIPVLEYNKEGETRYSLDDYMELENQLTGAKSKAEEFEPKIIEDELIFERKTLVAEKKTATETEVDPMDSPLEELLRERADERRRKLKDFNYKFQNSLSNIDEIEKQPAYKRQGVDLNENRAENRASRTSLSEDSNDEIQLRSNNSFLHDNVD